MFHYVGKTFTAKRTGTRMVSVLCEKCRTSFYYELTRVGTGKASAPYYLGQKSAADRATRGAERDLAKRLERDSELVPCPKCNWVNEDLVTRYRRRMYRRAPWLILCVVFIGPVIGMLIGAAVGALSGSEVPTFIISAVFALVSLLSPIWVLLVRRHLRRRVDPNASYPRRPEVPPGTPLALLEKRDPKTAEPYLEPVVDASVPPADELNWAIFRAGQLRLIPFCCICLDNQTTTYRPPMKNTDASVVAVPLCRACMRSLTWKWWRILLLVAVVLTAISAATAYSIPKADAFGRWMLFSIMAFFLSLLGGIACANQFTPPYKVKWVDRARGILKFSAANPRYTALLAKEIQNTELGEPL